MKYAKNILALGAMTLLGSSAFAFTQVTADITTQTQWTVANSPYILEKPIFVKSGGVLDIEPGVIIRGQPDDPLTPAFDPGALIVQKTGKIQARGTVANPIIFTAAAVSVGGVPRNADAFPAIIDRWLPADGDGNYLDATPATSPLAPINTVSGLKNTGYWGGVVIAGDSLTNSGNEVDADPGSPGLDDGYGTIEGLSGADAIYGGVNSEHNGGILKYVSIRHGGVGLVDGKELNGLTLYAVGSKTTVDHIDIYCSSDDGVEIFGGTVNINYLNINFADDDGLDIDEGYQGTIQYVFVLQGRGYGDNGMELDGYDEAEGNTVSVPLYPIGDARIYNATVIMKTDDNATASGENAARMRAGFGGQIVNSIFFNAAATAGQNGVRVDGLAAASGTLAAEYDDAPNGFTNARNKFENQLLQLRNITSWGFTGTENFRAFTSGAVSLSTTGGVTGIATSVFYPASSNTASTSNAAGASPGYAPMVYTVANGVNPRPSLAAGVTVYGTTQSVNYVPFHADVNGYRGAFDRTAASLWTTGWTALNKAGILAN